MEKKPSFFESLKAGALGMLKGGFILGGLGFLAGGAIGLLGGPEAALIGALAFAQMGISIGSLVGAVTGVVELHQAARPDPQDIINVANISFAQGVQAGKSKSVTPEAKQELAQASTHFQDQLAAEQGKLRVR